MAGEVHKTVIAQEAMESGIGCLKSARVFFHLADNLTLTKDLDKLIDKAEEWVKEWQS